MENLSNQELQAMIVVLLKRIEKLEGKKRMAPHSAYLKELQQEAENLLRNWH